MGLYITSGATLCQCSEDLTTGVLMRCLSTFPKGELSKTSWHTENYDCLHRMGKNQQNEHFYWLLTCLLVHCAVNYSFVNLVQKLRQNNCNAHPLPHNNDMILSFSHFLFFSVAGRLKGELHHRHGKLKRCFPLIIELCSVTGYSEASRGMMM